jgi:UDP-N-acetylmuramate--alanine ligase
MNLFLPSDQRPVHFVGIAGAGMSALAMLALRRGVKVTGSDRAPEGAPDLVTSGAAVFSGHDAKFVEGARAVVVSAAIPEDHPELARARELGIPIVTRKRALADLVATGLTVAVAGTHGKTTTTVMITEALAAAGLDPTGLAGGRVGAWGGNARPGSDTLFVIEADEYDQAFLELDPAIAVVNNVEPEHLECYNGSAQELEAAFAEFAGRAETAIIGCADDASDRLASQLQARGAGRGARATKVVRFGGNLSDYSLRTVTANRSGTVAVVGLPGGGEAVLRLKVPGIHNILNATAAIAVVVTLEGDMQKALDALSQFTGVGRRFEHRGEAGGVLVVDDYAHHATEVRATLAAAHQAFPGRRIVAVFQPHLYSRTQAQHVALGEALSTAGLAVVTEVYGAREAPIPGVSGRMVYDAVLKRGTPAEFAPDRSELLEMVAGAVHSGDVVLTLGAGDITTLGPDLLARLRKR